ncbi:NTF2-related export protein 1 isoform X1 [Callithrix jacchus]|uniref:Nuclear transport factor 2 like export factor 1 n=7 Tax=Platyrrhini TaxID=9479 RepID=A0A2R8N9P2_CALJA|nr:NTF2-related export protein 1 [Callithrix jacchus]
MILLWGVGAWPIVRLCLERQPGAELEKRGVSEMMGGTGAMEGGGVRWRSGIPARETWGPWEKISTPAVLELCSWRLVYPLVPQGRGNTRWSPSSTEPEMASVDFKTYVDQACRAAEEFVNVYYTTMDKRRRLLSRLYMGTATLVWNGNAVSGQESLSEFFEMLPSSEFQINVVDCQPVHDEATPSQTTVLVVICGSVKFEGNKQRDFNQNFILTAQASPSNTVWKIASDCFRFQDWAS